jgi:hypothetical protein
MTPEGMNNWVGFHAKLWEVSTMSRKQASKRRRRTKAVTVLGVAGAFSLAGGASAAIVGPADIPTGDTASRHVITLSEEEIFDVSLATFYVFDKENAGTHHPNVQLAAGRGCGGRGCGGRGCGGRGCRGCGGYGCAGGGCCLSWGGCYIC